jgi:GNAT superfamily N-acetyltransferase
MTDLQLRSHYWDDPIAREAFKVFLREIHGLDLQPWDDAGSWDTHRYTAFSFFEGPQRVVSSVCVYSMPALVGGRETRVAQLSGVGTLTSHRRQGLNSRLTAEALAWARQSGHGSCFLFADGEAVPYYAHRGFAPTSVHGLRLPLPPAAGAGAPQPRSVDDPATWEALRRLAFGREPLSSRFFTFTPELTLFHTLIPRRRQLYHAAELGAWLLLEVGPKLVVVHDLLAEKLPAGEALLACLAAGGAVEAEFRFPLDRFELPPARPVDLPEAGAMVQGPAIWPEPLVIPSVSWA